MFDFFKRSPRKFPESAIAVTVIDKLIALDRNAIAEGAIIIAHIGI
ncbi:MAG: hypothetical protein KME30_01865 [Iphinoe sp. HA4291-MV1]|nr:hypothetical protein [Iphinoe sp. HA4291-MV1]